jgi:GTP-binding protein HflX
MCWHAEGKSMQWSVSQPAVPAAASVAGAGKSTLLNTLTAAGVLAEDKLFATLDPTTRKVRPSEHQACCGGLSSIGLMRKLSSEQTYMIQLLG